MKTGPNMPITELMLMPRPRTTVGYNSEAISGRTTKEEDIPILPTQYSTKVVIESEKNDYFKFKIFTKVLLQAVLLLFYKHC